MLIIKHLNNMLYKQEVERVGIRKEKAVDAYLFTLVFLACQLGNNVGSKL